MKRNILKFILLCLACETSMAGRLKDIAYLRGVRNNQLMGYGLVVGLSGTGDAKVDLTDTSLAGILKGLGVDLRTPRFQSKNVAAVICNANLPPFARIGAALDVTCSSIGTSTSLDGGNLLMTPLRGPDSSVYAMAAGKVVTIKRNERSGASTGQTMVTAMIPRGAIVEKEVINEFATKRELRYYLYNPDFITSARAAKRINEELGGKYANALDAGSIEILLPYGYQGSAVDLVAQIESIDVEADRRARVVVSQRSGTVVLGEQVRIAPVAIAHNNLRIEIRKDARAPDALAGAGDAAADPKAATDQVAKTSSEGTKRQLMLIQNTTTISEIVSALNEMGANPDDLISLLYALRSAGALSADLEMM